MAEAQGKTGRGGTGTGMRRREAPRRKFDEIAEHIEVMILSGQLRPGAKIASERQLMEQFGAGRSSVREALFALQRKGLLTLQAGARAIVTEPSADGILAELSSAAHYFTRRPEGIRDLQQARLLFEVGLARHAALHATDVQIEALREALERNLKADTSETFIATDVAFHRAIATISQSRIFEALSAALSDWLTEQRSTSARAGATVEHVRQRHQDIFDAIARRDAVAAEAAMEVHLEEVIRTYWREIVPGG